MNNPLKQSFQIVRKRKYFIVFFAILYVITFVSGWLSIVILNPFAIQMRANTILEISSEGPIKLIYDLLRSDQLGLAILLTFIVNLCIGAFLSTTLTGIIPVLGVLFPIAITMIRGYIIGVTYPEVMGISPAAFILALGTLILELGAYVFSAAAGINISIAPIMPKLFGTTNRFDAFKEAWKETAKIYIIVIILLAAGAVWEITGLYLLMGITK